MQTETETRLSVPEGATRFLFDNQLMAEIEHYANKYQRSSAEIIMLGLKLFKMLDEFKDQEKDLAIVKKGAIVQKIVLT